MRLEAFEVVARVRLVQVRREPSERAVLRPQAEACVGGVWVTVSEYGTDVVRKVDVLFTRHQ